MASSNKWDPNLQHQLKHKFFLFSSYICGPVIQFGRSRFKFYKVLMAIFVSHIKIQNHTSFLNPFLSLYVTSLVLEKGSGSPKQSQF